MRSVSPKMKHREGQTYGGTLSLYQRNKNVL